MLFELQKYLCTCLPLTCPSGEAGQLYGLLRVLLGLSCSPGGVRGPLHNHHLPPTPHVRWGAFPTLVGVSEMFSYLLQVLLRYSPSRDYAADLTT